MKGKKVLKKYLIYNYTELDALKEYLEEMALQGWILTDINTWLTFKRVEPQKIIYSVELDKNARFSDRFENVVEIENIEEGLKEGWILITGFGKLRVYIAKNENALPIIKNEKEKLEIIVRSSLTQRVVLWVVVPLILIIYIILININHSNSMNQIYYFINTLYLLLYALIVTRIISFLVWKNKAKKRVELGGNVSIYKMKHLKNKNVSFRIGFIFTLLLAILSMFLGVEFVAISIFIFILFI